MNGNTNTNKTASYKIRKTTNESKMRMRKIMFVLGLLISINASNGQIDTMPKTMLEEFNLRGKVKTVTYKNQNGSHKLYFDENGSLLKQDNIYPWGGIRKEIYHNYIYEDKILKSFDITREFDKIDPLYIGQVIFEYNALGQLIAMNPDNEYILMTFKYDAEGNRIESYSKNLKRRQKFNSRGQVIEEWFFNDEETEVRFFGITDGQGNSLPDEIVVDPPYEAAPIKYSYNEWGDVVSTTETRNPQAATDTITLTYDKKGNWIERTANGNSIFKYYLTTEQIYTSHPLYGLKHISRGIEYYE